MNLPLAELLAEIESCPQGDHVVAFFDMDRTLIYGFSAQDLLVEQLTSGEMSTEELIDQVMSAVQFSRGKIEFDDLVREGTRNLRGQLDERNYEFGEKVFKKRIAARIYPEARALIAAHRRKGHKVVIVSAATPYQVEPVAYDLGVDAFLCTHLEVINGVCTGRIIEPACYGEGKSIAVRNFVKDGGVRTKDCYFYSDGHEDLPLLELVGNPHPLNPDKKLTAQATERGWPITRFKQRGRPKPIDFVRTSLAYLTAFPAAGAALADYALNRNVRDARNTFTTFWGSMSHGAIGIKSEIKGEEHLWSHRPCVFIANHQSAADVPVTMRMLRENFTGVGKIEVKSQPLIGQVAQAMGTIFVDRANHGQAVDALKPAVDAMREDKMSILIFPEGTRSVTNKLGRFKKGAFHIAMQAGVPVVPIVMSNTTDVLPKGAILSRPGTVEVTVLPPIQTKDWKPEELDSNIAKVRQQFLDVLGQTDDEPAVRSAPPVDASLAAGEKPARQTKPKASKSQQEKSRPDRKVQSVKGKTAQTDTSPKQARQSKAEETQKNSKPTVARKAAVRKKTQKAKSTSSVKKVATGKVTPLTTPTADTPKLSDVEPATPKSSSRKPPSAKKLVKSTREAEKVKPKAVRRSIASRAAKRQSGPIQG